jgi:hypothetical protein
MSRIGKLAGTAADLGKIAGAGADFGKIAGAGADFGKLTGAGADLSKLAGAGADLGKVAGAGADLGKLTGAGVDLSKVSGVGGDISKFKAVGDADVLTKGGTIAKQLENGEDVLKGLKTADKLEVTKDLTKISDDLAKSGSDYATFMSKNAKSIILTGVAATVVAGFAIAAKVNEDKINNTMYTITNITKGTEKNTITIIYTPVDKFSKNDTVTITNSNSQPTIDSSYEVIDALAGQITIKGTIEVNGTSGSMVCKTSFANQFSKLVNETVVEPTVQTAFGAAGAIFDELFPGFSTGTKNIIFYSLIAVVILFVLYGIFVFYKKFKSSSSPYPFQQQMYYPPNPPPPYKM